MLPCPEAHIDLAKYASTRVPGSAQASLVPNSGKAPLSITIECIVRVSNLLEHHARSEQPKELPIAFCMHMGNFTSFNVQLGFRAD